MYHLTWFQLAHPGYWLKISQAQTENSLAMVQRAGANDPCNEVADPGCSICRARHPPVYYAIFRQSRRDQYLTKRRVMNAFKRNTAHLVGRNLFLNHLKIHMMEEGSNQCYTYITIELNSVPVHST